MQYLWIYWIKQLNSTFGNQIQILFPDLSFDCSLMPLILSPNVPILFDHRENNSNTEYSRLQIWRGIYWKTLFVEKKHFLYILPHLKTSTLMQPWGCICQLFILSYTRQDKWQQHKGGTFDLTLILLLRDNSSQHNRTAQLYEQQNTTQT